MEGQVIRPHFLSRQNFGITGHANPLLRVNPKGTDIGGDSVDG